MTHSACPHHPYFPHSKSLFALVPRQRLEPRGKQNAGLRHSTLSLPLGTTLSGASARADPLQPPGDNAIHPASFALAVYIGSPGRSSSRLERASPQAHACLERTLVAHRRPTTAVCSGPEPRPRAASEEPTTSRGSEQPAWRQAFTAPNGVRFTRTP